MRLLRSGAFSLLLLVAVAADARAEGSGVPPPTVDPEQVVREAMANAVEIPAQAAALVRLAWPNDAGDPAVRAAARREIVGFSAYAIPAIRAAIPRMRLEFQEDAVRAMEEAFRNVSGLIPPDYPVAIEQAIWYGSEGAKAVAIPEAARLGYRLALVTILDATREFPALTPACIDALGALRDDRARFFLERQMQEGKGEIPEQAARALARIGSRSLLPLKAALRSDRRSVREAAARAFLPVATVDDLSALHEYVADHPKDDPATLRAVRQVATILERVREAKDASTGASPG